MMSENPAGEAYGLPLASSCFFQSDIDDVDLPSSPPEFRLEMRKANIQTPPRTA